MLTVLSNQWRRLAATRVHTRKGLEDLKLFDARISGALYPTLSAADKALLRIIACGGAITNDVRKHWNQGITDTCDFCGEPDSKTHRYFHCRQLRDTYAKTPVPDVSELPPCLTQFGLAVSPPELHEWTLQFQGIHFPDLPKLTSSRDKPRQLFGDGSGFFPDEPRWRTVAFGVVDADDLNIKIGGQLSGALQTVTRGEIIAGLCMLRMADFVHLFSDHLGFVRRLRQMLAGNHKISPVECNHDLWQLVLQQVLLRQPGSIQVTKVKAHVTLDATATVYQQWLKKHNDRADDLAKAYNKNRNPLFWQQHTNLRLCEHNLTKQAKAIQQRLVAVAKLEVDRIDKHKQLLNKPTSKWQQAANQVEQLHIVDSDALVLRPFVYNKLPTDYLFGPKAFELITSWLRGLKWPAHPAPEQTASSCISLLELMFDFQLSTGCQPPVKVGKMSWAIPDAISQPDTLLLNPTVGAQLCVFARTLRELARD
ncbi:unnamed protein product [Polarella glacialis]|uniref:RNase H type-1 domain-containing protein n=1 Tax=Polarella glacialis TaxID=89957 RepID=A0A813EMQ5_POLGL|nr:unnamed protein product [Polarella glacialis]